MDVNVDDLILKILDDADIFVRAKLIKQNIEAADSFDAFKANIESLHKVDFGLFKTTVKRLFLHYRLKRYRHKMLQLASVIPGPQPLKEVTRFIIAKGTVDSLNSLISNKSGIDVDLKNKSTITPIHIQHMKTIVRQIGINLFYYDIVNGNGNCFKLASASPEVAEVLETHILNKAKRYRNFFGLVYYVKKFPDANYKKILFEIFKNKNSFSAKWAFDKLKDLPECQKYINLS